MDKISVIVPVYNVEKYLKRCLDSIINQTYKNLEIILINDGSTDNSGIICDEYAKKDNRIIVKHKENSGVSSTKNLGMKISTGEFITFIDSDDTVDENYIEILYNNLISTNSDISVTAYKVVNEKGNLIQDSSKQSGLPKDATIIYEGKDIIRELLLQKTIKNFVCKLYRKEVLCNFKEGVTYEDIVFSVQVMMKAKKVVYINTGVYNYLKRSKGITATITLKNLSDFAQAIIDRFNLVQEKYNDLMKYNVYAFFQSTIALSTKYIITDAKYDEIIDQIEKFITIIKNYDENNQNELSTIFTDYDKLCLYLIKYNTELYLNFLLVRHNLKKKNKLQ